MTSTPWFYVTPDIGWKTLGKPASQLCRQGNLRTLVSESEVMALCKHGAWNSNIILQMCFRLFFFQTQLLGSWCNNRVVAGLVVAEN